MNQATVVRVGELILLTAAAAAELSAIIGVATHVWFPQAKRHAGRPARRVTPFEQRLHNGRAIRAAAFLMFIAGAVISLLDRLDDPLTVRSVFWTLGATGAFVSWTILDRRRWEIGVT
jgi:hypothetical protein